MNGHNKLIKERVLLAKGRVKEIRGLTAEDDTIAEKFIPYFRRTADYLCRLLAVWEWLDKNDRREQSLEALKRNVNNLYKDILPENYGRCYGNPAYACACFGKQMGRILSFLYAEIHSQIESAYEGDLEGILIRMELFLEIYQEFTCSWQENPGDDICGVPKIPQLRQILYWFISDYTEPELAKQVRRQLDPKEDFFVKIVMDSDLNDLKYLYYSGEYITENEEKLAAYLNGLPEETIRKMADAFTEGYRLGFETTGKDLSKKKTVNIRYTAGFERVIRAAVENFRSMGLEPTICRASLSIFHKKGTARVGFCGAEANRQFLYDHKDDQALYLDKKYVGRRLEELKAAYEVVKELAAVHGGPACMEAFGEDAFAPETKEAACSLNANQQKLAVEYASGAGKLVNQYIKAEERSYTIIAFPAPAIGEKFAEIFDAVIEINTLDYRKYRALQQTLIDALDTAETVRVKGCGKNRTDLTVALRPLNDPEKETLFENCVADVNIPVGEVFTSPRLKGTDGVLHVTKAFLEGLEYRDLELVFRDGMIVDYHCGNFETEEENKKYIKDNVLFQHETLPMGEFAIGTNTTAYMAARKYDMADRLPILIAEKTGPHFAVGDTCYSHSEDLRIYNPDGKEIVAKDNECSAKRMTNVSEAYFNCHTDVTIPYDELGELIAVSEQGEIPIIRGGRFVLPGCEELNLALET